MLKTIRSTLLILLTVWTVVLLPSKAMAADLRCVAGLPVANTKLWGADGQADTQPGEFCYATGVNHIFSTLVCNTVRLVNDILGRIYCSMQIDMQDVLGAAITLYLFVFGAQILMGTAQLSPRDVLSRLLKIAGVWVFATNASWGIDIAFDFFVNLASMGIFWVIAVLPNPLNHAASGACFDAAATAAGGVMGVFAMLDEILCTAISGSMLADNAKVLGFFAILSYVIPPIFGMGAYWLWINFSIMVRALVSFLLGVVAMAFLISLSPLFLSFMLFRATHQFFENWLKYIISFALQLIIIFACIALWIIVTVMFIEFFEQLSDLIFPYNQVWVVSQAQDPISYWSICDYNVALGGPLIGPNATCTGSGVLIPASELPKHGVFLWYLCYHIITLILLGYAFQSLMKEAPNIAKQLAGPKYIPSIGMGFGVNKHGMVRSVTSGSERGITGGSTSGRLANSLARGSNLARSTGEAMRDMIGRQASNARNRRV